MQAHTKKHPIREPSPFPLKKEESINQVKREGSINWRDAFKEAFGDMPPSAVSLKGMRNREGWTQAELGEKIGVSQANLSKMERGHRPIGKTMAKRLADVFETDYRIFL